MTYAQLQELRELAQSEIARQLAELTPSSGRGVVVQSGLVTVQPDALPTPEPAEETWLCGLYMQLSITSSNGERVIPYQLAGHVSRIVSGFVQPTSLWGQTQIIQTQPSSEELEPFSRSFVMELSPRTFDRLDEGYENTIYRIPLRVVIEEVQDFDPNPVVIRSYDLAVPRSGVRRTFTASSPEQSTILRLKSISRL